MYPSNEIEISTLQIVFDISVPSIVLVESWINGILFTCSGYGIAARALTAILRAHDGRGLPTKLTNSILQSLGLSSPDELIGYFSYKAY